MVLNVSSNFSLAVLIEAVLINKACIRDNIFVTTINATVYLQCIIELAHFETWLSMTEVIIGCIFYSVLTTK